ncbi:MAG: hypothetical protein K0U74_06045 [Alphaproteobacteria bacterium]|nr:hypothetical protein [Alphaproteobacteria bacterium]
MNRFIAAVVGLASALVMAAQPSAAVELPPNDYPTVARADYVFGCMQVNGQSRDSLFKCSCSIDKIAELLPYSAYEEAETVMSVLLKGGENVAVFRHRKLQDKVARMKKAQVEAELRCF